MKILVTGASGLVGRYLCENLASAQHEVFGLVRKMPEIVSRSCNYIVSDLTQPFASKLEEEIGKNLNCIVHLAQSSNYKDYPENSTDLFSVNIESTFKLFEYARQSNVDHVILASTGGVYRSWFDPATENNSLAPITNLSPYLRSKLCAETLAHNYVSDFYVTILRPFFIFGCGQKRSMLLPRLFDNVKQGLPIYLAGEIGMSFNPIHADDASKAISAMINQPKTKTINLAGSEIVNIREASNLFGEHLGLEPNFIEIADPCVDMVANIDLLTRAYFTPTKTLKECIFDVANK